MASTFNVQSDPFVTAIKNILDKLSNRTVSISVTTASGATINASSPVIYYSLSGNAITINMNGFISLTSQDTVTSATFTVKGYTGFGTGTITVSGTSKIDGLSVALQPGLYLVMLSISVQPQPASVYL